MSLFGTNSLFSPIVIKSSVPFDGIEKNINLDLTIGNRAAPNKDNKIANPNNSKNRVDSNFNSDPFILDVDPRLLNKDLKLPPGTPNRINEAIIFFLIVGLGILLRG